MALWRSKLTRGFWDRISSGDDFWHRLMAFSSIHAQGLADFTNNSPLNIFSNKIRIPRVGFEPGHKLVQIDTGEPGFESRTSQVIFWCFIFYQYYYIISLSIILSSTNIDIQAFIRGFESSNPVISMDSY